MVHDHRDRKFLPPSPSPSNHQSSSPTTWSHPYASPFLSSSPPSDPQLKPISPLFCSVPSAKRLLDCRFLRCRLPFLLLFIFQVLAVGQSGFLIGWRGCLFVVLGWWWSLISMFLWLQRFSIVLVDCTIDNSMWLEVTYQIFYVGWLVWDWNGFSQFSSISDHYGLTLFPYWRAILLGVLFICPWLSQVFSIFSCSFLGLCHFCSSEWSSLSKAYF